MTIRIRKIDHCREPIIPVCYHAEYNHYCHDRTAQGHDNLYKSGPFGGTVDFCCFDHFFGYTVFKKVSDYDHITHSYTARKKKRRWVPAAVAACLAVALVGGGGKSSTMYAMAKQAADSGRTVVVTTTTHKTLRGPRGGLILCKESLAKQINKAVFPGTQGGPLEHIIAAKAVCFGEALKPEFKTYQEQVIKNAQAFAKALTDEGFRLVSGGTDNHLILIDLQNMNITGKDLEKRLDAVYITANKNAIPNDPQSAFVTSGLRVGTPAVTTRGFKEEDMVKVAHFIKLAATDFDAKADEIRAGVTELCNKYPIYE